MGKERLAGNKFGEICVCVSPTQAKMYAIKPKIPETYNQPDALYLWVNVLCWAHLSGETQIRVRIMALTALGFILYKNGLGLTKKLYGFATSWQNLKT